MRVMLDTNILVSAFVFRSKRFFAVIDYIVSHHELVLALYVVDELKDVIARKFPTKVVALDEFLTALSFTLVYSPQVMPTELPKIRDVADAPILYTAIIESIDVFITGDKDFFDVDVDRPVFMTVSAFERTYMMGEFL